MRFCNCLLLILFSSQCLAHGELPAEKVKGVTEVVTPKITLVGQLGLGIFDAWVTQNSFLIGPRYGYNVIGSLLAEIPITGSLGLRFGAMYEPREIGVNQGGTVVGMSRNTLVFPLEAQFEVLPLLSLFGGGYFGLASGDWTYSPDNPAQRADLTNADFGFTLGIEIKYPISFSKSYLLELVTELSYFWGLTNMARNPIEDFRYRGYHFLAGISLGI